MPDRHPHIKVRQDPEIEEALRKAAPYLKPGMSVSQQIRHLAIIGTHSLSEWSPEDFARMQQRQEELADLVLYRESADCDRDRLRELVDARRPR